MAEKNDSGKRKSAQTSDKRLEALTETTEPDFTRGLGLFIGVLESIEADTETTEFEARFRGRGVGQDCGAVNAALDQLAADPKARAGFVAGLTGFLCILATGLCSTAASFSEYTYKDWKAGPHTKYSDPL